MLAAGFADTSWAKLALVAAIMIAGIVMLVMALIRNFRGR